MEHPICLAFPDWEREIYIEADASSEGVAAVMSQKDRESGILRPINFFSSALSNAQKNYSAGQLEAWALVAATRKWDLYPKSVPEVILLTDHNPLQWLRRQRDPRQPFARWLLELEEIPYQIKYRPGTQKQLPDYLSRKTRLEVYEGVNCEDPFENKIYHVEGPGDRIRKIRAEQGKDYVVREAIRQIGEQGQVWRGQFRKVATFLSVKEVTLYFDTRIVVPKTLQFDTVQRVHSEVHFGQARTLQLVRRSYFWIGLTQDVKTQCRTCKV